MDASKKIYCIGTGFVVLIVPLEEHGGLKGDVGQGVINYN